MCVCVCVCIYTFCLSNEEKKEGEVVGAAVGVEGEWEVNEREGLDVHAQHRQHHQEKRKSETMNKKERERRDDTQKEGKWRRGHKGWEVII